MKTSSHALSIALSVFAIVGVASLPAQADEVRSIKVTYSDLNLASNEGHHALYSRVAAAAREVCPSADPRVLREVAASHKCQKLAIAQALREVKQARLAVANSAR